MYWLITTLLGGMFAWATCRKNAESGHGGWVLRAGLLGGLLPHLDILFAYLPIIENIVWPERYGLFWTPIFAPFWVALVTTILTWFIQTSWLRLYAAMLIGWWVTSFTGFLIVEGVIIFPFMAPWQWGIGLINTFDYVLLALTLVILALGIFLPFYRRDIARVGVLLFGIYLIGLGYVKYEAHAWAQKYATALNLEVAHIYTLPQPLSPLNWRIMVVTADEKIHDTFINLRRADELAVTDTATRAWRVQALYKPKDRAVWRVYDRLNGGGLSTAQQTYVQSAWQAAQKIPQARRLSFSVHTGFRLPPYAANLYDICAVFRDLRFEGARHANSAEKLVCSHKKSTQFTLLP